MTSLDTNGNNDVVSIVMMDVHVYWVTAFFSLKKRVCIYWFVCCAYQCFPVSWRQRQHFGVSMYLCMYICTSRCILKSVCNLYIIENARGIVTGCSGMVELGAWKLLYSVFHCLLIWSRILIKNKGGVHGEETLFTQSLGVIGNIQGYVSVLKRLAMWH